MINSTARAPKYLNIFNGIFSSDRNLYQRIFYFFGLFACTLVFLSFLTFFFYFLTETTQAPQEVRITNITDQSVTVTWKTTKKTLGLVVYSPAATPRLFRPIALLSLPSNNRRSDDFSNLTNLHSVTLNRLSPNTNYLYRISTGLHTYKVDLSGQILPGITTTQVLNSLPSPNPLYGQVLTKNNLPAINNLIYLSLIDQNSTTRQSTVLSAVTNDNGYYIFDLTSLRTTDLKSIPIILPETQVLIEAESSDQGSNQLFTLPNLNKTAETITLK